MRDDEPPIGQHVWMQLPQYRYNCNRCQRYIFDPEGNPGRFGEDCHWREPVPPALEAVMGFLYAIVAPGQDATKIIAANPDKANAAHKAIYERRWTEESYHDMMSRVGRELHEPEQERG